MIRKLIISTIVVIMMAFTAPGATSASEPDDSITHAAASILGSALRGSIENIESLGIKLDRPALMQLLSNIVTAGAQPRYSYDRAYAIIDSHVASIQNAYVDSVFAPEAQQAFVDDAAKIENATTTPSGLVFIVLSEGKGVNPASGDDVVLNYVGKFSDGSVFDQTDEPVTFDVDNLVPGFSEGLKMMRPGGKYRLVIPAKLAYGDKGIRGDIPPNATLDFTIDLLQIRPKPSTQSITNQ